MSTFWDLDYHDYSDPDGWYMASGLDFVLLPVWPGHPGLPVVLLVQLVARGLYVVSIPTLPAAEGASFEAFVVTHLTSIAIACRVAMALAHLFSIWVVLRFTRKLLPEGPVALLATLAYASSWPVLLYAKRISAEPFMVAFALLAILCFWQWLKRAAEDDWRRAHLAMAGLAACTTAGIHTKFTILTPLHRRPGRDPARGAHACRRQRPRRDTPPWNHLRLRAQRLAAARGLLLALRPRRRSTRTARPTPHRLTRRERKVPMSRVVCFRFLPPASRA